MSGIAGGEGASRFFSPSNDYNRSGGEGTMNVNVVSNMSQISNRTNDRLFQVASESPESSELVISSSFRAAGSPFNFTSDIGGPLFRPRLINLGSVVHPAIPNINRQNSQMKFQFVSFDNPGVQELSNPVNLVVNIPEGYYDEDSFGTELVATITSAVIAQFPGQAYSRLYKITAVPLSGVQCSAVLKYREGRFVLGIQISRLQVVDYLGTPFNLGGPGMNLMKFWLNDSCNFVVRGKNFIEFPSAPLQPTQSLINPPSVPAWLRVSGWDDPPSPPSSSDLGFLTSFFAPQFIYTRYITVSSEALSLYAFGQSRVDRVGAGGGAGLIIGVIDTANFNSTLTEASSFEGYNHVAVISTPSLGIKNPQLKLNELIDFVLADEFGDPMDLAFPEDNKAGVTMNFIVSY